MKNSESERLLKTLFPIADLKSGIFMKFECLNLCVMRCTNFTTSGDAGANATAALLDRLRPVSAVGWWREPVVEQRGCLWNEGVVSVQSREMVQSGETLSSLGRFAVEFQKRGSVSRLGAWFCSCAVGHKWDEGSSAASPTVLGVWGDVQLGLPWLKL